PCGRAAERERPTPRRRGRSATPGRTTPSRRLRDSSGYSPSVPSSESGVSHDTAFLDHFHKALAGGTPSAPSGLGVITRDPDHDGAGLESKRVTAMPVVTIAQRIAHGPSHPRRQDHLALVDAGGLIFLDLPSAPRVTPTAIPAGRRLAVACVRVANRRHDVGEGVPDASTANVSGVAVERRIDYLHQALRRGAASGVAVPVVDRVGVAARLL